MRNLRHYIIIDRVFTFDSFTSLHCDVDLCIYTGLLYGTEQESSQLLDFLVMADGGRTDVQKEEWLTTCSSFQREGTENEEEILSYYSADAELLRLVDNKQRDCSNFSPLFVTSKLISCRSVEQSKQDRWTCFYFWHTLSQMIFIVSDILPEPLVSPVGQTWHSGRMRNNWHQTCTHKVAHSLKIIIK